MKTKVFALMLVLSLASLSWSAAQGAKTDLFDLKKSRQELEIMKGVLNTTLGFAATEIRGHEEHADPYGVGRYRFSGGGSNITAYYLVGQGATFIVPISSLRLAAIGERIVAYAEPRIAGAYEVAMKESMREFDEQMKTMNLEMVANNKELAEAAKEAAKAAQELARELAEEQVAGIRGGVATGVPGGVRGGVPGGVGTGTGTERGSAAIAQAPSAPPAQAAPAAPPRPARPPIDKEEMRKKLEDTQAKIKQTREEAEARRNRLLDALTKASGYLVEALANHGDSLTHVRPNEYINIIITTDDGYMVYAQSEESRSRREVLSVQKSIITDYKAGRITLDAFRQKVLQYGN